VIRIALPHDINALADIEHAADGLFPSGRLPPGDSTYPREGFVRAIECDGLLVSVQLGKIVGFAVAELDETNFHLYLLAVHPDFGRRGLGRELLLGTINSATVQKCQTVTLTTFDDIAWNAPFYERIGFKRVVDDEQTSLLRSILQAEQAVGMSNRVAMTYEIYK